MEAAAPGTIGGTYIGDPVSCAAASAAIRSIHGTDLKALGEPGGRIVRGLLEAMREEHACIGDVRGPGAMLAIELLLDQDPRAPGPPRRATSTPIPRPGRTG